MTTAVILAGGASRRMGFDKQTLIIHEQRLINNQIKLLLQRFDHVLIISNNQELLPECSERVAIVPDMVHGYGPIGGLFTAMHHLEGMFYVVACDMPNVDLDYIDYLRKHITASTQGVITRYGDWIEPFHGFYSKSMKENLKVYLDKGQRSIHQFLLQHPIVYIPEEKARVFSPDWLLFDNINTKEDLLRVENC